MTPEEIKQSIDLANYIRSCGIELRPHGKNDLIGHCPFHDDNDPSLVITPSKQLFHCFGCNKAGSVIDFAMHYHKTDLKEAINNLTKHLGANPQKSSVPSSVLPSVVKPILSPERANQLLQRVVTFYKKTFTDTSEGRQYLESRGITDAGLFSQHHMGYCNGTLTDILPGDRSIHDELKELGILLENGHERFTGCVVFPVFDTEGNITTLYARHTEPDRKQHMFLPDRSKGLWNIAVIKTYPEIILVESIIDALSVQMAGHNNVVAINGSTLQNSNGENRPAKRSWCTKNYSSFRWRRRRQNCSRSAKRNIIESFRLQEYRSSTQL